MTYDEHSLISWLESQALEAHNHLARCQYANDHDERFECEHDDGSCLSSCCNVRGIMVGANKTLAYLRNTRAPQLHRKLMEKR